MKKHIFLNPFLCLFLASGCGTSVGNPGKNEPPVENKENQTTEPPSDNPPQAEPTATVGNGQERLSFDPSSLGECSIESAVTAGPGSNVTTYQISFATDSSLTATDVKFYFYTSGSQYVERTLIGPVSVGTYYVYAISDSLKAGCAITISISEADLAQPVHKTYKLKTLP